MNYKSQAIKLHVLLKPFKFILMIILYIINKPTSINVKLPLCICESNS